MPSTPTTTHHFGHPPPPNMLMRLSILLIFSLVFSLPLVLALDSPPQLVSLGDCRGHSKTIAEIKECLENAMRLHFVVPDQGQTPAETSFWGHVYLKGFFFSAHCHLDYSRQPISQPFYMHIPYRSECQVKRERSNGRPGNASENGGENEAGFTYSIVVIVQHHRLFVTNRDKAYSITCFYRDARREFERRLEIGDLTPSDIAGQREAPTCQYEVLREGASSPAEEAVRFANIGEVLIHRWSCDTEEMGMLVHSCTVRDGLGHSFPLVDQRGCVTDASLVPPLTYTTQLNSSSAPISAFKFADQMVVYFRCQITLCDKRDNGCEGITPPNCELIPLPSEGGPAMPVLEAARRDATRRMGAITRQRARNPVKKCCQNAWWPRPQLPAVFGRGMEGGRRASRNVAGGNGTANGTTGKGRRPSKLITVDVVADGMIVFTRDEGPSLEERNRLTGAQNGQNAAQCQHSFQPLWALSGLALLPLLIFALLVQRHILQGRINALSTFSPSYPVEMSGFPSAFGQSPIPKPRHYGRL